MFSEHRYARGGGLRDIPAPRRTSALVWLLCAMAAGFIIQTMFENLFPDVFPGAAGLPADLAAFSPAALRGLRLWTLATYALLHGGLLHLLANSLVIFFLGREVLPLLGNLRFALLSLASAAGGALLWFAFNAGAPPGVTLVGASSIGMALLVLFACLNPDAPITVLLFFIIPVSTRPKYIALIAVALDLLGLVFYELPGRAGPLPVAHSAHLGGALVGLGYYYLVHRREWLDPDGNGAGLLSRWRRRKKTPAALAAPKYKVNITPAPTREELRAEVDRILDKINSQGFASLTDAEKSTLDQAKDALGR
jgi:membrane associated rhomboid family serine protease